MLNRLGLSRLTDKIAGTNKEPTRPPREDEESEEQSNDANTISASFDVSLFSAVSKATASA